MKDLNRIYDKAIKVITDNCDIDPRAVLMDEPPKLVVNKRATTRWGQAQTKMMGGYVYAREIQLSDVLLDDNADDFPAVETMIHEILHLLTPHENHGGEWKRYAGQITRKTEFEITTCGDEGRFEKYGVKPLSSKKEPKYIIKCTNCGHQWSYQRMTRAVQYVDRCTCGGCGAKLIRIK